jgi:phage tail-like protein
VSELLRAFRFEITLAPSAGGGPPLGDGGFQECTGLELAADVREYLEGGRNDGVVRRVGRVKLSTLVLKRGMFAPAPDGYANTDLWSWLTDVVRGVRPVRRYDGDITVQSVDGTSAMAVWHFTRGLPLKVTGPTLNAQTGEVALEELHIAHEGLHLEPVRPGAAP